MGVPRIFKQGDDYFGIDGSSCLSSSCEYYSNLCPPWPYTPMNDMKVDFVPSTIHRVFSLISIIGTFFGIFLHYLMLLMRCLFIGALKSFRYICQMCCLGPLKSCVSYIINQLDTSPLQCFVPKTKNLTA